MPTGADAAMNAPNDLFKKNANNENYGVALVDADNSFNSIVCILCDIYGQEHPDAYSTYAKDSLLYLCIKA